MSVLRFPERHCPPDPTPAEVCGDFEPLRLVQARNLPGWTRRDLAEAAGCMPQQVCWWESAVTVPKPYEIERAAQATGRLVTFLKRGRPMAALDSAHLFMCSIDQS